MEAFRVRFATMLGSFQFSRLMPGKSLLVLLLFFGLIVIHRSSQQVFDGIYGGNLYQQAFSYSTDEILFWEYINSLCAEYPDGAYIFNGLEEVPLCNTDGNSRRKLLLLFLFLLLLFQYQANGSSSVSGVIDNIIPSPDPPNPVPPPVPPPTISR